MPTLTRIDQERLVDHGTDEAELALVTHAVNRVMNDELPWFTVDRLVLVKKGQVDFKNVYRPTSEAGWPVVTVYREQKPNGQSVEVLAEHRFFRIQAHNQPEALIVADDTKRNIEVSRGFHQQPQRRS
jgi:hypothetical protein